MLILQYCQKGCLVLLRNTSFNKTLLIITTSWPLILLVYGSLCDIVYCVNAWKWPTITFQLFPEDKKWFLLRQSVNIEDYACPNVYHNKLSSSLCYPSISNGLANGFAKYYMVLERPHSCNERITKKLTYDINLIW